MAGFQLFNRFFIVKYSDPVPNYSEITFYIIKLVSLRVIIILLRLTVENLFPVSFYKSFSNYLHTLSNHGLIKQ